jgi:hypothetical protein
MSNAAAKRYTILFHQPDDAGDDRDYDAPPWTIEVDTLDEAVDAIRNRPDGSIEADLYRTAGELICQGALDDEAWIKRRRREPPWRKKTEEEMV